MDLHDQVLHIDDWVVRARLPEGAGPHPAILLLHGWTGDENVMWVFASRLPAQALLISPRGLYPAPQGGFSWYPSQTRDWPWVDDFRPALDALADFVSQEHFVLVDLQRLYLVGFSQGAALAYAMSLLYPARVAGLAGLAGFLPGGAEALARNRPLVGKPVFVAHGVQDERVPVERARSAVNLLEQAGADVTYCEDDVGHKLSAGCFRGLDAFFRELLP